MSGIFVLSGQTSSGTLTSGEILTVEAGGTASLFTIASGGFATVSSGGTAENTVVETGGILVLLPGADELGTSNTGGTIVSAGVFAYSGTTPISSAAHTVANGVFAGSSVELLVLPGGTTQSSTISSGANEYVYAGGVASGDVVNGAQQTIFSGGIAAGGIITDFGQEIVSAGGSARSVTVEGGANQFVEAGGNASSTLITNLGAEFVHAGGTASATTLTGGSEFVSSGGAASRAIVSSGGSEVVFASGQANGTTVDSGGGEFVFSGGAVSAVTVNSGGIQFVLSGGTASDTTVEAGAVQVVLPQASVTGTIPAGGQIVSSGVILVSGNSVVTYSSATVSGTTVSTGETEYVLPHGTAVTFKVSGTDDVASGGLALRSLIVGGTETVFAGGTAASAGVKQFGTEVVLSGGLANFTVVSSTGSETVSAGGTAHAALVSNGGVLNMGGSGTNIFVQSGGTENLSGQGVTTGTVLSRGAVEFLLSGSVASGTVIDSGGTEYVYSGGSGSQTALTNGGTLDISYLTFSSGISSAVIDSATDLLTVTEGAVTYTQVLSGNYASATFLAGVDGVGGTDVTVSGVTGVPCYCRGSRILTEHGNVPVEELQVGDGVVTHGGAVRMIRWIGHRSYDGRFVAGNRDILPIRIRRGALADDVPQRDLLVSPLHAMFLDDVLIPAVELVNGSSIRQVETIEQITYFHVELDSHDIILAEGAPSESYVDDDNRGMFRNAADYHASYPDATRTPVYYCAPRIEDGELLEAVRRRLADRLRPPAVRVSEGDLTGNLDIADRARICGWARDTAAPDRPVRLRILDNGVAIAEVTADECRSDLEAAGFDTVHHGFQVTVPGGLSPLTRHLIEVRRTTDGAALPNSPLIVDAVADALPADPAPICLSRPADQCRGHLDELTRERVVGWAQDPADPDEPVALVILDNGIPIARVLANRHRADLERAGIGQGRHCFDVIIAGGLSPLARHVVHVKRERDGADISGSPAVIEAVGSFDADLEQTIARATAALDTASEQKRALVFLLDQADRILQRHADSEAGRTERQRLRQFRRRHGPGTDDAATGREARRVLVVDGRLPVAGRDAGSQAVLSHIRALQRLGYTVSIVAADQIDAPDATLVAQGITVCRSPFYASVEDVLRRQGDCFDLVYLHRADVAARYLVLARHHAPRARVLYSVADLHHVRLERQARLERRPELLSASHRMRLQESVAALLADVVLTHSTAEIGWLGRIARPARVHRVGWDVPVRRTTVPFSDRHGIAFIGSYAHAPNVDAAGWLAETIMPLVWQTDPTITCSLVGSDMPDAIRHLARPGITVDGYVEDLGAAVFDRVRLTVAPVRFGAGIKGKILESLAAGVPCVMSEIAAEGLALPRHLQALVGGDAAALAGLICRLHGDEAAAAAAVRAGLSMIRRDFSTRSVTAGLRGAIDGSRVAVAAAG